MAFGNNLVLFGDKFRARFLGVAMPVDANFAKTLASFEHAPVDTSRFSEPVKAAFRRVFTSRPQGHQTTARIAKHRAQYLDSLRNAIYQDHFGVLEHVLPARITVNGHERSLFVEIGSQEFFETIRNDLLRPRGPHTARAARALSTLVAHEQPQAMGRAGGLAQRGALDVRAVRNLLWKPDEVGDALLRKLARDAKTELSQAVASFPEGKREVVVRRLAELNEQDAIHGVAGEMRGLAIRLAQERQKILDMRPSELADYLRGALRAVARREGGERAILWVFSEQPANAEKAFVRLRPQEQDQVTNVLRGIRTTEGLVEPLQAAAAAFRKDEEARINEIFRAVELGRPVRLGR